MAKSILSASLFDGLNIEHVSRMIATIGDPNGQYNGWIGMYAMDISNTAFGSIYIKTTGTRAVPSNTGWSRLLDDISTQTIAGEKRFSALTIFNNVVDINTTIGQLIVPRMTTVQRDALLIVNGSVIYNTTTNKMQAVEAGVWVNLI